MHVISCNERKCCSLFLCNFFLRWKATRMAASMLWNVLLTASGGILTGTAVWGKPGTTNACVLTLTSWILCLPGRKVDDFTFRQSCAAPACCFMLRTNLLAQVCQKYYVMVIQMLISILLAYFFGRSFLKVQIVFKNCIQTSLQMSLQLGATCVTSCQLWNICILVVLCIWIWNLLMSSWLPLGVWSWGISDCCLSWNTWTVSPRREKRKMTCRREIPSTWPPSCSEGNTGLLRMFSGMWEKWWNSEMGSLLIKF